MNRGEAMPGDYPTATLRDGAVVLIRPLASSDFDAAVFLADTLSVEERYLRFFTAHPTHIDEWATSLTDPGSGVVALGAYEGDTLIGVVNYVETARPGYAELAVVVAHHQHERGVGTALLGELGRVAQLRGQRHFVADVLAENYEMRRVLRELHWPCSLHLDGSVLRVDVDLTRHGTADPTTDGGRPTGSFQPRAT